MKFEDLMAYRLIGSPIRSWLVAAILACATIVVLVLAKRMTMTRARRWAEGTTTHLDDVAIDVLASLHGAFFVALGLWVASEYVELSPRGLKVTRTATTLCVLLQVGVSLQSLVRRISLGWAPADADGRARTAASASAFLASLTIWAVLIVSGLAVLGFEISALVAGLGVGGVAAALAVQNILGDLFASLSKV